ncbi:hypothetical protein AAVH_31370, partial [Aphelenchoides avenae]
MREDGLVSEQPGRQYPPMLASTAHPSIPMPVHQVYADARYSQAEWELDLNTAHEYVMAEEGSVGIASKTLPSDSTLRVGYVLSDTNAFSLVQEVQEVESLLSVFRLEDEDIIPPQTRSSDG